MELELYCSPNLIELLSDSIGLGAGLQTSRLVQSKCLNPLKVFNKEYKVIYLMYQSTKFGLVLTAIYIYHSYYLTATLLGNSVELSSNLYPEPLMSGTGTRLLTQSNSGLEWLNSLLHWSANQ